MYFQFESLCFVPICLKLLEVSMLTEKQKSWLNSYHEKCRELLIPAAKEMGWDDVIQYINENTKAV